MNYLRRAAGAVGGVASSGLSYIPGVGGYFSGNAAPAGTTNNTTRRNNRAPVANTPVASAPVVAAPAPAPVAVTGGGSAAMGIVQRMKMEKEAQLAKEKNRIAKEALAKTQRNAAKSAINWSSPEAIRRATAAAAFANIQHSKNIVEHVTEKKAQKFAGAMRRRRATRKAGRR